LLAGLTDADLEAKLSEIDFRSYTEHTITQPTKLKTEIEAVRRQGWALADQELEIGVRSIACPVRDQHGQTIAALNISGHASRVSLNEMTGRFLPALQRTVFEIEKALHNLL
jgi:IclR family pca regulon transcriptional regulator